MGYKILIFTILSYCCCFGFVVIPEQVMMISVVPMLYYTLKCRNMSSGFAPWIIAFYIFLTLNTFTCYYYRGQTPLQTVQTVWWVTLNGILVYFILQRFRFSEHKVEKLISKLYIIFCLCYLVQFIIFPTQIFRILANGGEQMRFRMLGQLIVSLGFFFHLNRLILFKKRYDIFKVFLGLLIFLLLGFRSMLAAVVLASIYMFYRINGLSTKLVKSFFIAALLAIPIYFLPITQEVIQNMVERQKNDNFDNDDYIRWVEWDYYNNHHFKSYFERILGSGIPKEGSQYGKSIKVSQEVPMSHMFQWVDWGIIGLSWIIGIPAVLCLLIIIFKAIFSGLPKESVYLSVWYVFLLLTSVTTIEFFRSGSFIFNGIALYLIDLKKKKYNGKAHKGLCYRTYI